MHADMNDIQKYCWAKELRPKEHMYTYEYMYMYIFSYKVLGQVKLYCDRNQISVV